MKEVTPFWMGEALYKQVKGAWETPGISQK
jgi:hypothetical protein